MNVVPFNKTHLIRAFNRSASTCQEAQLLSREIGHRLLERLELLKIHPQDILDLGTSTGAGTEALSQRYPQAMTMGLDIAKHRLFKAQTAHPRPYICADIECLPIKDQSMDLVFSNLALHFCTDLYTAFQHVRRIVRPNGLFLFSMFGLDTLKEIRNAWQVVDDDIHVYGFPDMHHVGDALLQTGFQDPVMDMEYLTLEYATPQDCLSDLKKSGATHFSSKRAQGLLSRQRYRQLIKAMEDYGSEGGSLPVTFEIIYGYAMSKFALVRQSF